MKELKFQISTRTNGRGFNEFLPHFRKDGNALTIDGLDSLLKRIEQSALNQEVSKSELTILLKVSLPIIGHLESEVATLDTKQIALKEYLEMNAFNRLRGKNSMGSATTLRFFNYQMN